MKNTIPSVRGAIVSDHLKKTFSVISAEICVVKSAHSFLFEFHFIQRSFPVSLDYLADQSINQHQRITIIIHQRKIKKQYNKYVLMKFQAFVDNERKITQENSRKATR